jgi:HK97 family phage major capsid protein
MPTMRDLKDKKAALLAEAGRIFKAAEDEKRDLSADEKARDDAIHAELSDVNDQISRLERHLDSQRQAAGSPDTGSSGAAPAGDGRHGFTSLADFAAAVRMASPRPGGVIQVDPRLSAMMAAPADFHREGGSSDGYMVPPALRQEIWSLMFAEDDLLSEVDSEPTNSNAVQMFADETTPWGASGVSASWRSEGSQMSSSRLATEQRETKLHELYSFVLATEELLEDAPRLNARLTAKAAQALRWKINKAMFEGTGAGQPLGWTKSSALVTVAKESGQTAATVVAANVANMFSRNINPAGATWYVNQSALPQLMTMTLGQQPIWMPPSSGFVGAPGGFLLGRPVRFSHHCEALGTAGDLQFVDPKGYYAAYKASGIKAASSMHLYFDYGIQAFRWTFRFGGQPYLSAAVTPNKGSATLSHFVRLATRS